MNFGLIKTAAASPKLRMADCRYNAGQILASVHEAEEGGARILCLPELCLTGVSCGALFRQPTLLKGAEDALSLLLKETEEIHMLIAAGLPVMHFGHLYNVTVLLLNGHLLGAVPKRDRRDQTFSLPPEGISNITLCGEEIPFGEKLLFICDKMPDLRIAVEAGNGLFSPVARTVSHAFAGATLILNPFFCPETVSSSQKTKNAVRDSSARFLCGILSAGVGEGESTADFVCGGQRLIAENGAVIAESPSFSGGPIALTEVDVSGLEGERLRTGFYADAENEGAEYLTVPFELPVTRTHLTRLVPSFPFVPASHESLMKRCRTVLTIQTEGLAARIAHSHAKTAVLGISGGLDSCLALLVAVSAMDKLGRKRSDVIAVTMPCFGTTARTKGNAERMTEILGAALRTVDIHEAVQLHFRDIGHDPEVTDVTYENSQARERTQILMDIANETGGFVVGTGDMSELALGWATYNGDHMSMYGVNAGIPKTMLRHLVRFAADNTYKDDLAEILLDILDTPVSPELLPAKENGEIAQRTEDLVGPYELHDFFLYYGIRCEYSPAKVYALAKIGFKGRYENEVILKWLRNFYRRFFTQQFKRNCLPDGPAVGSLSLSPRTGYRIPSDAAAALWLEEIETLE